MTENEIYIASLGTFGGFMAGVLFCWIITILYEVAHRKDG